MDDINGSDKVDARTIPLAAKVGMAFIDLLTHSDNLEVKVNISQQTPGKMVYRVNADDREELTVEVNRDGTDPHFLTGTDSRFYAPLMEYFDRRGVPRPQ